MDFVILFIAVFLIAMHIYWQFLFAYSIDYFINIGSYSVAEKIAKFMPSSNLAGKAIFNSNVLDFMMKKNLGFGMSNTFKTRGIVSNSVAFYVLTLNKAGKYNEAKSVCEKHLKEGNVEKEKFMVFDQLALAYRGLGNLEKAKSLVEEAIIIKPESSPSHTLLANIILEMEGDQNQALAEAELAISVSQKNRMTQKSETAKRYLLKAWALVLLNRQQEADTAVAMALPFFDPSKKSDYAQQCYLAARVLIAKNEVERAKSYLNDAIKADPNGGEGKIARKFLENIA